MPLYRIPEGSSDEGLPAAFRSDNSAGFGWAEPVRPGRKTGPARPLRKIGHLGGRRTVLDADYDLWEVYFAPGQKPWFKLSLSVWIDPSATDRPVNPNFMDSLSRIQINRIYAKLADRSQKRERIVRRYHVTKAVLSLDSKFMWMQKLSPMEKGQMLDTLLLELFGPLAPLKVIRNAPTPK
jgi:hypothetical protein